MQIKRGDIFLADLSPTRGSEQSGRRPVLVIQNDIGNEFAPTTIIAPFTTKSYSKAYPTNVTISKGVGGLKEDSIALFSQIRTIDKERLEKKIGSLPRGHLEKIRSAIQMSLGL